MKIKLTPEISYVLGLWRHRKTRNGIGVSGNEQLLAVFTKAVIDAGMAVPGKLLSDKDSVYFYHTAYRKYLQEIEEKLSDVFKHKNEYSQKYLAGLFDAKGGFSDEGYPYISGADKKDEMVFLRLGFRCKLERGVLAIVDIKGFKEYIKDYSAFLDEMSKK